MLGADTVVTSGYVRNIMSSPVITVDMDDRLGALSDLFRQHRIHHTIVVERGRVRGVISDRDVLRTVSPFAGKSMMERSQDENTLLRRAHRFMTRKTVTIGPGEPITQASRLMVRKRVSCLPVIDEDDELVGIVTSTDILRWLANAC